jgi:transposase
LVHLPGYQAAQDWLFRALTLWEEDGYAIWYKRLEIGCFRFPPSPQDQPRVEIRAADLVMLFEGVDLSSVKRGKRYHRPVARATV